MKQREEFVRFVLISGFAAAMNFGLRFAVDLVTSFEVAVVLSYLIAMTTAFLLNRAFVFRADDGSWRQQYMRFTLVNLISLAQVFIVSVGLDRLAFPALGFAWHREAVAHFIGLASPILTSYWGHRRFSFASKTALQAPRAQ